MPRAVCPPAELDLGARPSKPCGLASAPDAQDFGKSAVAAENILDRQFHASGPDLLRGTGITYIRPHEGWLYLSVVIDVISRHAIGWSAQSRRATDLAMQALLMAVWRRKPKDKVLGHSDQGSQFRRHEWQALLRQRDLEPSMSPRGNCHDTAVAERFFQLLKRERIR